MINNIKIILYSSMRFKHSLLASNNYTYRYINLYIIHNKLQTSKYNVYNTKKLIINNINIVWLI